MKNSILIYITSKFFSFNIFAQKNKVSKSENKIITMHI